MSSSTRVRVASVALAAVAMGCASTPLKIAGPIGPAPTVASQVADGELLVYTDPYYPMEIGYEPAMRLPYVVLDLQGSTIRKVQSTDSSPEAVALPAGDYVVRAPGLGRTAIDVTVRVVPGRTTEVHLDGTPPAVDVSKEAAVYGPNGKFVGWRAPQTSTAHNGLREANPNGGQVTH